MTRLHASFGYAWALLLAGHPAATSILVGIPQRHSSHLGEATADVSADGRFVALESLGRLLPMDTDTANDVYVLELSTGRTTFEGIAPDDTGAHGESTQPRLSGEGRYVVFEWTPVSAAAHPSGGPFAQIVVRDRLSGDSTLVSRGPDGTPGNGSSRSPDITHDGRFIVFESSATNLVPGPDANGRQSDVYVFDMERVTNDRVSVAGNDCQVTDGWSAAPSISDDGQRVAFASTAAFDGPTTVQGARAGAMVWLRDRSRSTTTIVSRTGDGRAAPGSASPSISGDGRFVAFTSAAADIVAGDTNGTADVFLHDLASRSTVLISRSQAGRSGNQRSGFPTVSKTGRYVAFASHASDLVCGRGCADDSRDLNLVSDIYLYDHVERRMMRLSGAVEMGEPWWQASAGVAMDAAGAVFAFSSRRPVDDADLTYDYDLFVVRR